MKKIRNMRKRTGFTLVELLIVIIIIGILAGSMMLVAGSGTDRAEATKIISDLRSLKAAALMGIIDRAPLDDIGGLSGYMDRTVGGGYKLVSADGKVIVGFTPVPGHASPPTGVAKALASSAADSGLYLGTAVSADTTKPYQGGEHVWMRVN